MTVTDSELGHAQNLGSGGHGYLFEVSQSNDVLFRDCVATAGRHNFIQNWGFGTSGVVWLRVTSRDGQNIVSPGALAFGASSEFHHSFAMANLIDSSRLDDGWDALNRKTESQGAGHTATESVFWNVSGQGTIRTYQYGWGYVIGTTGVRVQADLPTVTGDPAVLEELGPWTFTRPLDWIEGEGMGATLEPTSLYGWQLQQRQGR